MVDLEGAAWEHLARLCADHPLGYTPALEWKNLRVSAGLAYYKRGAIALSRILITDEDRLNRTLIHEYAHLLAYVRKGRKGAGHGPAWRQAMADLGVDAEVYHRYEAKRNAKRQQVTYACCRCQVEIVRHRRLPRKGRYVHAGCGGAIKFVRLARLRESET